MTSASMPSMIALYMDDDDHRHHDDPVIHIEDDVSNGRMVHTRIVYIRCGKFVITDKTILGVGYINCITLSSDFLRHTSGFYLANWPITSS